MQSPISIIEQTNIVNMVARVVVKKDDIYLLIQEGNKEVYGLWAFPGGKIDVGEVASESAVREVYEETGVRCRLTGLLGVRHQLWEEASGFTVDFLFTADVLEIDSSFPELDKTLQVCWKTLPEIDQIGRDGKMRNILMTDIVRLLRDEKTLHFPH